MSLPAIFHPQNLPPHIAAAMAKIPYKPLLDASRTVSRISLKSNRFHQVIGGQTVHTSNETHLDVVLVASAGKVGRTYFDVAYDPNAAEKARPRCWSADGVKPHGSVASPMSASCASCPMNIKGSAAQGNQKAKACAYQARLAVVLPSDPDLTIYQLDAKGGTLFGTDYPTQGMWNLTGYTRLLESMKTSSAMLVTRITMDMQSSTPKLFFAPLRFLSPEELEAVAEIIASGEADGVAAMDTVEDGEAAPVQHAPVQQAPVQQAPAQQAPVQYAPVQQAVYQPPQQEVLPPVQYAPVQHAPVQHAPAQQAPAQEGSALSKGRSKPRATAAKAPPVQAPVQQYASPTSPSAPTYQPMVQQPQQQAAHYGATQVAPSPSSPVYAPAQGHQMAHGGMTGVAPSPQDFDQNLAAAMQDPALQNVMARIRG